MKYVAGAIAWPGSATASPAFLIPMSSRFLRVLWFQLAGTLTIAGGTGVGTINPDNAVALLQQITIKRNGRPIKIGSGGSFLRLAQRYYAALGSNGGITSAAAGTYNFFATFPIVFEAVRSVSPTDTYLDERLAGQNLEVDVTWGDNLSLITGNTGATQTLSATSLTMIVDDTAPFALKAPFWTMDESETLINNVVNGDNLLNIPWSNAQIVRGIQLRVTDTGVAGGGLTDNLLKQISVLINGNSDKPWDVIPADFTKKYQDYLFEQSVAEAVGYYHLEFAERSKGGLSMVGTTGLGANLPKNTTINSLQLKLNCGTPTGVGAVTAHLVAHLPPSAYAQATT